MHLKESDRLVILDVLRGLALLGMLIVHFNDFAQANSPLGKLTSSFIDLFIENKSYTTFAMLFGVGFALQIQAAKARNEPFILRLVRRLLGIGLFGIIAEGIFGFHVLIGYAIWGFPLLIVSRWSTRALLTTVFLCSASLSLFYISVGAYKWITVGVQGERAAARKAAVSFRATAQALKDAESQPSFRTVVTARFKSLPWQHTRPYDFTPWGSFVVFLIGLLALRHGVFEQPNQHRHMIMAWMVAGVLSWAAARWLFPLPWPVLPVASISGPLRGGLQIFRDQWLALTYIGTLLLIVGSWPGWLHGFKWFAWTGRMALTNYMIQVMVVDWLFRPYGLGITLRAEVAIFAALILFIAFAFLSHWWLHRFHFGPAEWLLRSITYWKSQPMVRSKTGQRGPATVSTVA
jgi:uncharacterized protein